MSWNFKTSLLLAAFVFAISSKAMSGEKKKDPQLEAEEKEARAEDEAAVGKDNLNGAEFSSRGKLILTEGADDPKALVLGVFVAEGRTYQVKIEREELRNELKPYNNKEVALAGKIRNNGKY